jgi:hypothetical protein
MLATIATIMFVKRYPYALIMGSSAAVDAAIATARKALFNKSLLILTRIRIRYGRTYFTAAVASALLE